MCPVSLETKLVIASRGLLFAICLLDASALSGGRVVTWPQPEACNLNNSGQAIAKVKVQWQHNLPHLDMLTMLSLLIILGWF